MNPAEPLQSIPPVPGPSVDAHTHINCWGENPRDGFLSEQTRKSWLTPLIMDVAGINRERGDTLTEKVRNRLLREVEASQLDYVIVLTQETV